MLCRGFIRVFVSALQPGNMQEVYELLISYHGWEYSYTDSTGRREPYSGVRKSRSNACESSNNFALRQDPWRRTLTDCVSRMLF